MILDSVNPDFRERVSNKVETTETEA
jgi:hypothetical protein